MGPFQPPMGQQPWMKMMTWACQVLPLLPGLLQQPRAGLVAGQQQPLSLVGTAKTGKLHWEKHLGKVGAAHSRSAHIESVHVCFCSNLVEIVMQNRKDSAMYHVAA